MNHKLTLTLKLKDSKRYFRNQYNILSDKLVELSRKKKFNSDFMIFILNLYIDLISRGGLRNIIDDIINVLNIHLYKRVLYLQDIIHTQ